MEITKATPYIITICSGKGGVGKSVLSANLAYAMSEYMSVLIWDADLHYPNQHLLFGVEPPVRMNDVYIGNLQLDNAIFRINHNLHLLANSPDSTRIEDIRPSAIFDVYHKLLDEYDYDIIIIDAPAGATEEVVECCGLSDLVNVVITDEPTSLLDAYGLIKMLIPYIGHEKINLLINNVIDYEDAEEISTKLNLVTQKFLKINLDVLGYIPYERIVRQSILQQELFVTKFPDSEVTRALMNISSALAGKAAIPAYL